MTRFLFYFKALLWFWVVVAISTACDGGGPPVATSPVAPLTGIPSQAVEATYTPTMIEPTFTPAPLAVRVNGVEITLAEYQAELALYRAASGVDLSPEEEKRVLDDMIDQALLAQAATEKGFMVDETLLQERINTLSDQLGGEEALADWMATYGFTSESFSRALARSISAVWMRDQIVAAVPKSAEQVHARQILLYNSEQASEVYAQLEAGNDFGNLALQYDPLTGGDLGWIPRGYLPNTDLEEAAFVLEPEQFSPVIKTLAGFHILQVIGRDPQRPLPPEAFVIAQTRALQEWLEARRDRADIQLMLP